MSIAGRRVYPSNVRAEIGMALRVIDLIGGHGSSERSGVTCGSIVTHSRTTASSREHKTKECDGVLTIATG
jgi:hypothetical protein